MNSLQPTNCLSVFDHFRRLVLKGLRNEQINPFKPSVAFRVKKQSFDLQCKKRFIWNFILFKKTKKSKKSKKII